MGSFDGWSRGVRLSHRGGDSVFRRFEGTLRAHQVTPHPPPLQITRVAALL